MTGVRKEEMQIFFFLCMMELFMDVVRVVLVRSAAENLAENCRRQKQDLGNCNLDLTPSSRSDGRSFRSFADPGEFSRTAPCHFVGRNIPSSKSFISDDSFPSLSSGMPEGLGYNISDSCDRQSQVQNGGYEVKECEYARFSAGRTQGECLKSEKYPKLCKLMLRIYIPKTYS
jgi:hypothetical protein